LHEWSGTKHTTKEEKDVGVWTKNLKPSEQCQKAATRGKAVLNQLAQNIHYWDRHPFMRLYKQYGRPHLVFASPAWSPWLQGDKDVLEKVQEKAVKMVSILKTTTYLERCDKLKLETLEKKRLDQDMALVYKLANEKIFSSSKILKFVGGNTQMATRMTAVLKNLVTQHAGAELRKASFALRVKDKWNQLSAEQKNACNSTVFRRMRKRERE
jgi:hypothetical protein